MQIHDVEQGSPEWHALRARHFCASDAPVIMGLSKYKSRRDWLRERALGIIPEVDAATQKRFDDGHASEAATRPWAQELIGEDLYPVVGTEIIEGMPLLASFDGITIDASVHWEGKLWNQEFAAMVRAGEVPDTHWPQLEHQCLVKNGTKCLFTVSDGADNKVFCWYESRPERRAQVIAAWKQTEADLATYQHVEDAPQPQGAVIEDLPALTIQVEGRVVASNLKLFRERASAFIATIKTDLQTDQDFADADKMVKFCSETEKKLDLVKDQAQSQAQSIDQLFKAIDQVREEIRQKRLTLEKLVTARKDAIRADLMRGHQQQLEAHVAVLMKRCGASFFPNIDAGFPEAMKGKKTIAGLRDALHDALTAAKMRASQVADTIQINYDAMTFDGEDWSRLFPDFQAVCTKAPDDFKLLLESRVRAHLDAEQKRVEAEARKAAEATVQNTPASVKPDSQPGARFETAAPVAGHAPSIDTITQFLDSREWKKGERDKARAILVEFVKFTSQPGRKAA